MHTQKHEPVQWKKVKLLYQRIRVLYHLNKRDSIRRLDTVLKISEGLREFQGGRKEERAGLDCNQQRLSAIVANNNFRT